MKNIAIRILLVFSALTLTQCFEEKIERVAITPFEDIEAKLKELRELQKEVNDVNVEATDLQAQIDGLIEEINSLVPPGNVPLTYSIGILSAGSENQLGIAGAVATINIRGQVTTATSNSSGQVRFDNLRSGVALVHITHPNYSDVSFVVNLLVNRGATTDANNSGEDYNVTSAIGLYPTSVSTGAVVHTGDIFFDPDRTNDILQSTDPNYGRINFFDTNYNYFDGPYAPAPRLTLTNSAENTVPTVYPSLDARVQSWVPLNRSVDIFVNVVPDPFFYSYVPVGTEGNIILAVYEDMFVRASSTATGTFTLTLPRANRTLEYRYRLSEFDGQENYFRAENLNTTVVPNTTTFTARTRDVIYSMMYVKNGEQFTVFTPGTNNAFNPLLVNSYNEFWGPSVQVTPLSFFYGAKSRNE